MGLLFSQMEFDLVCGEAQLQRLLAQGWLAPPKYRRSRAEYLLRCEHSAWDLRPHAQYKPLLAADIIEAGRSDPTLTGCGG